MTSALRRTVDAVALWVSARDIPDDAAASMLGAACARYGVASVWISGGAGNTALRRFERVLAASGRTRVASAVANLWAEPASTLADWALPLIDTYGADRLLLGIGVSHAPSVTASGLGVYQRPLTRTEAYVGELLDAGVPASSIVLGAQGPAMLRLAALRTAGAHPYLVTPQHTRVAREHVGSALLVPEQTVVLERSAVRARAVGREFLATYLALPNYVNNWRRLGFGDDDVAGSGSDRLVDSVLVWGTPDDVAERLLEHVVAGADEVALRFIGPGADPFTGWAAVRDAVKSGRPHPGRPTYGSGGS